MKPIIEIDNRSSEAYVSVLHGATRTVILVGRWAVKLPNLRYGWRPFLRGLIANGIEREWWRDTRDPRLCPVLFGVPGGWLLVMPRCEPIGEPDEIEEPTRYAEHVRHLEAFVAETYRASAIPAEIKADSFGWLGGKDARGVSREHLGRLVAVDYGN
jgi:hypothetical protein